MSMHMIEPGKNYGVISEKRLSYRLPIENVDGREYSNTVCFGVETVTHGGVPSRLGIYVEVNPQINTPQALIDAFRDFANNHIEKAIGLSFEKES